MTATTTPRRPVPVTRLGETLQDRLHHALRSRVAGPDAASAAERIWRTPGPRWFTEDDPIWRVHADASMFPGGIAALLLQSLHPSAMAGVAGHSGFRGDPWGRLQRTSHYLATTTFGTIEHAERSVKIVRAVHRRVSGVDERGVAYAASDPHLLRWVHVAEVWSFLRAHQLYGARPLDVAGADRYVEQATVSGELLGGRDLPRTVAQLERALEGYRDELAMTDAARDAAAFLLREPPLPVVARPGYALIASGALGMLPPWASAMLDLPAGSGLRRSIARGAGVGATRLVRWGMSAAERHEPSPGPAGSEALTAPAREGKS